MLTIPGHHFRLSVTLSLTKANTTGTESASMKWEMWWHSVCALTSFSCCEPVLCVLIFPAQNDISFIVFSTTPDASFYNSAAVKAIIKAWLWLTAVLPTFSVGWTDGKCVFVLQLWQRDQSQGPTGSSSFISTGEHLTTKALSILWTGPSILLRLGSTEPLQWSLYSDSYSLWQNEAHIQQERENNLKNVSGLVEWGKCSTYSKLHFAVICKKHYLPPPLSEEFCTIL